MRTDRPGMAGRLGSLLTPVYLARAAFLGAAVLLSLAVALILADGSTSGQDGQSEPGGSASGRDGTAQDGPAGAAAPAAGAALYLPLMAGAGNPASSVAVGSLRGSVQTIGVPSPVLGSTQRALVYLPPDYDTSGRSDPVLYLLHGADASDRQWLEFGLVDQADIWIREGTIPPVIIVLPSGGNSYWANHREGGPRWADYIAQDLTGYVDSAFRTLPHASARAIGGLSMGGYGALLIAFRHPDVFGVAGGHSPSLRPDDDAGNPIVGLVGEGGASRDQNPVWLAERAPGLESLRIWLDAGDRDDYRHGLGKLSDALTHRGIDHAYHILTGGHDYDYWIANSPAYLQFYAGVLAAEDAGP